MLKKNIKRPNSPLSTLYNFACKVIRTKLGPYFALKYLLVNFVRSGISLKLCIRSSSNIEGNTRHTKLYFGKVSNQLKLKNILFKLVKVVVNVLTNSSTKYSFFAILSPISLHL
jgi:hypothetical protein